VILYRCEGRTPGAPVDPGTADQIRSLSWHALEHNGALAIPGDQLHRLSMDLATGSAGVLLALGAALAEHPVHLPFLGPAKPAGPSDRPVATRSGHGATDVRGDEDRAHDGPARRSEATTGRATARRAPGWRDGPSRPPRGTADTTHTTTTTR